MTTELEAYHEMAMDERPDVACAGRGLKMLHNALVEWWDQERGRGDVSRMDLLAASPTIAANLVTTMVHQICLQSGLPISAEADFIARIGRMIGEGLARGAEAMAKDEHWHEGGGVFNAASGERQRKLNA